MNHGVSHQAFHNHFRTDNLEIINDFAYGRIMRLIAINLARLGLLDTVIRAARLSPEIYSALFDAVSAHAMYKDVMKRSFNPKAIKAVIQAMI